MLDLIIKNGTCFIDGKIKEQDISIKNGKILKIGKVSEEAKETYNAKNLLVLPGCIDTQTHLENRAQQILRIYIQEAELRLQAVKISI